MDEIELTCTACGKKLRVPADRAGQTGRCPGCRAPIEIDPLAGLIEFAPGTETEALTPAAAPEPAPVAPPRSAPAPGRPAARPSRPAPGRPAPGRRPPPGPHRPRRRSSPAPLIIAAVAVVGIVAMIAVLGGRGGGQPAPGPSRPPDSRSDGGPDRSEDDPVESRPATRTTLADVVAGKHPASTRVEFPAIVLPIALIREDGSPHLYYTLAVARDAGFFLRLQRLGKQAEEWMPVLAAMEEKPEDQERFNKAVRSFIDLEGEMENAFLIPTSDVSVGVRLQGFERVASRTRWEEIKWRLPGSGSIDKDLLRSALFGDQIEEIEKTLKGGGLTLGRARTDLRDLLRRRPPDLSRDLPAIEILSKRLSTEQDVEKYNEIVDLFNTELMRRRRYTAQEFRETLLSWRANIRRLLAMRERPLHAVVEAPLGLGQSYILMGHQAPKAYVAETTLDAGTFAARYYSKTDVLLTSYPPGARITVNGMPRGTTPVMLVGQAVGRELELEMRLEGHESDTATVAAEIAPDGVQVIRRVLRPE